ncbi:sigma-70 family RNA polymerase sigma factor [Sphingobacterium sp.]|uniref:RNA polymerase sigma factor n=1 Tax=Sphingobacterium sp. TaxID=341027 RepID=UPI002585B2BD|nr:sigma-70 family RNA polymerase sigma factor [Sphingobacterium sp.]WET67012.1 MAG: sigma-70 family RNA polymerase sigma factor [Sphingobacterium sp.]
MYWQPMFLYAMAILKDKDNAEDVVQEVFTGILHKYDQIQIKTSLENYLYTCIRNQALLMIRKTGREDAYVEELSRHSIPAVDTTTEQQRFKELSNILESHVKKLTPTAKEVFLKNRLNGQPHKKIALELGISEESSRTILYRTIKNLKSQLKPFLSILLWLFLK